MRRRIIGGAAVAACAAAVTVAGLALASGSKRETAAPAAGSSDPIAEAYAQMDEARRRNPGWERHRRPVNKRPRWVTLPRPPEGLMDVTKSFPSAFYLLEAKGWRDWHNGWTTVVYAGAFTQDRPQGIVIVERSPYPLRKRIWSNVNHTESTDRTRAVLYRTPVRAGSVRIVGVSGDVLRLVSDRARQMTFDLSQRRFHLTST